jgi:hypothetical protein
MSSRTVRGQAPWLIAVVLFLLAAAGSLYAGGRQDSVLSEADGLIENKEYDSAIQILIEYIKTNPDKFSDAQKRLQKIVRLREEYNTIADELLNILVNDPDNTERIIELTNRLTSIESAANPSTFRFLAQVRELAVFTNNRNRLERILAEGSALLAAGDYRRAIEMYASGLDIYRDEYFASKFGEDADGVVNSGLEDIARSLSDFSVMMEPFSRTAGVMAGLNRAGSSPGDVSRAYSNLAPRMEELAGVMTRLAGVESSFAAQLEILRQKDESLGDRSFLSFAGRLIRGPAGQNEGMLGVLDRFWQDHIVPAENTVAAIAENSYNLAQVAAVNQDFSGAAPYLENVPAYLAVSMDMINNWLMFYQPFGGEIYFPRTEGLPEIQSRIVYDQPVLLPKIPDYVRFQAMVRSADFIRQAGDIGLRNQDMGRGGFQSLTLWREGRISIAEAVSMEDINRGAFHELGEELAALEAAIAVETGVIQNYQDTFEETGAETDAPVRYMNMARDIAANINDLVKSQELAAVARRYTVSTEALSNDTLTRENEFAEGNRLVEGIEERGEGAESYIAHYLAEGLAILTDMNQKLAENLGAGRVLLNLYTAEPPNILAEREVGALYSNAVNLVTRLENLRTRSGSIMATVRTQIARADALRLEGDRLYQESQAALLRNNFDVARERLQRATERYHDSLAIQESASLRSSWDTRLVNLGAEIVRVENEIVVRDVRALLTTARNSYYAGNLEQAEEVLVRAQNRWNTTNASEEPEIAYWLGLVRGALSLQSGRTIPVTAPLYAEMSQLLSDARKNYDEGVRFQNAGRRQEGLAKFEEARRKTREVRLMFPMNHDARLLELRIDQQIDQNAFNITFRQRLDEAVAGTKPNVRSVESFAELQDLVELNPGYPGIRQLLSQAEIDMGYRLPPPNPRDLARSTQLTEMAMEIINARNSAQYEVALAQLNEALQLNPNNSQAMIGKDQVQTWMTGTGVIVLDSYSQNEYNRAVQEFQRGNTLSALAIVQQLLQNPQNRNSTLILELQRRIESVL